MKLPHVIRRRVAGIPLSALLAVAAVLFALNRIPPSQPRRSPEPLGGGTTAPSAHGTDPMAPDPTGTSTLPRTSPTESTSGSPRPSPVLRALINDAMGSLTGDDRLAAIAPLLAEWLATSPADASAWTQTLPAGDFRTDVSAELLLAWSRLNPDDAAAWLASSSILNPESASVLAGAWASANPAKAASWAASLPNPTDRTAAHAAIATAWASSDPTSAATWSANLPNPDRAAAITSAADSWARSNPAAAAAWLASLSPANDPSLVAAAGAVVHHWTESNPGDVSRWLNNLSDGPTKESAIALFSLAAAPLAPTDALLWATSLSDPALRSSTVADVCERWYDAAPDEFKAQIPSQLDQLTETPLRHAIYQMLYEKDPEFRDTLLRIADGELPPPDPPNPPQEPPQEP